MDVYEFIWAYGLCPLCLHTSQVFFVPQCRGVMFTIAVDSQHHHWHPGPSLPPFSHRSGVRGQQTCHSPNV